MAREVHFFHSSAPHVGATHARRASARARTRWARAREDDDDDAESRSVRTARGGREDEDGAIGRERLASETRARGVKGWGGSEASRGNGRRRKVRGDDRARG